MPGSVPGAAAMPGSAGSTQTTASRRCGCWFPTRGFAVLGPFPLAKRCRRGRPGPGRGDPGDSAAGLRRCRRSPSGAGTRCCGLPARTATGTSARQRVARGSTCPAPKGAPSRSVPSWLPGRRSSCATTCPPRWACSFAGPARRCRQMPASRTRCLLIPTQVGSPVPLAPATSAVAGRNTQAGTPARAPMWHSVRRMQPMPHWVRQMHPTPRRRRYGERGPPERRRRRSPAPVAPRPGFEPGTSAFVVRRSLPLSYRGLAFPRAAGGHRTLCFGLEDRRVRRVHHDRGARPDSRQGGRAPSATRTSPRWPWGRWGKEDLGTARLTAGRGPRVPPSPGSAGVADEPGACPGRG